ncbi:hypothetical protein HK100_006368 [Physocladia obscura]|uniref:NADH dehydrogenase [ubiquinone] iron-sulfur protein 4, mitochondrial n=1 Tax=Physocladia obscura TaxID=109957 RepID=A0AAD5TB58_9FUNG|nr:hypothetical protein HK100_006368 [Physocladia obscura]
MHRIIRSATKQGSVRSLVSKPSEVAAQHLAAAAADSRRLFQAELESGVPASVTNHPVRIYRPANTPTQSGSARPNHWRLDFDTQDKWENKLIGWVSSADSVQALSLKFATKEDAVLFAERQGYEYWIDLPKESLSKPKVYADNFKYSAKTLRLMRTNDNHLHEELTVKIPLIVEVLVSEGTEDNVNYTNSKRVQTPTESDQIPKAATIPESTRYSLSINRNRSGSLQQKSEKEADYGNKQNATTLPILLFSDVDHNHFTATDRSTSDISADVSHSRSPSTAKMEIKVREKEKDLRKEKAEQIRNLTARLASAKNLNFSSSKTKSSTVLSANYGSSFSTQDSNFAGTVNVHTQDYTLPSNTHLDYKPLLSSSSVLDPNTRNSLNGFRVAGENSSKSTLDLLHRASSYKSGFVKPQNEAFIRHDSFKYSGWNDKMIPGLASLNEASVIEPWHENSPEKLINDIQAESSTNLKFTRKLPTSRAKDQQIESGSVSLVPYLVVVRRDKSLVFTDPMTAILSTHINKLAKRRASTAIISQASNGPNLPSLESRPITTLLKNKLRDPAALTPNAYAAIRQAQADATLSAYSQPLPITRYIEQAQKRPSQHAQKLRGLRAQRELTLQEAYLGNPAKWFISKHAQNVVKGGWEKSLVFGGAVQGLAPTFNTSRPSHEVYGRLGQVHWQENSIRNDDDFIEESAIQIRDGASAAGETRQVLDEFLKRNRINRLSAAVQESQFEHRSSLSKSKQDAIKELRNATNQIEGNRSQRRVSLGGGFLYTKNKQAENENQVRKGKFNENEEFVLEAQHS